MKKILFFRKALTQEGGAERLLFEVAGLAKNFGFESHIVVLSGGDVAKLFDGRFSDIKVKTLHGSEHPAGFYDKALVSLAAIFQTRKTIKEINPDFIFAQGPDDAEVIYFATLGTGYKYSTFIHQSLFWCPDDVLKYIFPFRKNFDEVRGSVWGHKYFIPEQAPTLGFVAGIIVRLRAILNYLVVRRAENIFVPSAIMGKEVLTLYGKNSIPLKMGVDENMPTIFPGQDVKKKLGTAGILILEVSRSISRSAWIWLLSFRKIAAEFTDTSFRDWRQGPEKENWKL